MKTGLPTAWRRAEMSSKPPEAHDKNTVRFTCLSHATPVSWESSRSGSLAGCPECTARDARQVS